jgi:hypothetical protein
VTETAALLVGKIYQTCRRTGQNCASMAAWFPRPTTMNEKIRLELPASMLNGWEKTVS